MPINKRFLHAHVGDFFPLTLNPKLYLDAYLGAVTDGAAQFTAANSESLSHVDSASLSLSQTFDWWWCGWIKTPDNTQRIYLTLKDGHSMQLSGGSMGAVLGGTSQATVAGPSNDTWTFYFMWFDSVAQTINIQKNNGTPATASFTTSIADGTEDFFIGAYPTFSIFSTQTIDSVAIGKSPTGGFTTTTAASIIASLYNGGLGKTYGDLTSAEKTAWGLVSFWNLNELSGTRYDAHGSNNLTDNNTVTSATGIASGTSVNNDPMQWYDQSTNTNNILNSTFSKRPTWIADAGDGKPAVLFDGVDDFLHAAFTLVQPEHVFIVYKLLTVGGPGVNDSVFDGETSDAMYLGDDNTPRTVMYAGNSQPIYNQTACNGVFGQITCLFNGASSKLRENGVQKATGDSGNASAAGLTLASRGLAGDRNANIAVRSVLLYSSALSTANELAVEAWQKARWGTP